MSSYAAALSRCSQFIGINFCGKRISKRVLNSGLHRKLQKMILEQYPHISGLFSCRGFVFRAQFRQLCSEFMDTIRAISPRRSFMPQESVRHVEDAVWKSSRKDSVCSEEENVISCPLSQSLAVFILCLFIGCCAHLFHADFTK